MTRAATKKAAPRTAKAATSLAAVPSPDITIAAVPIEGITVELVGVPYVITPPKSALAMRMAINARVAGDDPGKVFEVIDVWISKAFGEAAPDVLERLEDEHDALDLPHIMNLMSAVIERQTSNPPT